MSAAGSEAKTGRNGRAEARRRAFLDAATEVFLESGYSNATLDAVIRRSRGSRQTLYALFGSKEGLFEAIVSEMCASVLGRLADPEALDREPEDALTHFGEGFAQIVFSPVGLGLFRVVIAESPRFPDLARSVWNLGPERSLDLLGRYLAHQATRGRLVVPDAREAAGQFLGMLQGNLHLEALLGMVPAPSEGVVTAHVRAAVRQFLDGCRPRAGTAS